MSFRIALAAGTLALSMMALPVMTLAQNPPETSGSATGGTVAPAPAKDAPAAPGAQSPENAESEASSIASRIEAARKQGKTVDTSKYGNLSTPAYPWLGPAVDSEGDAALQAAADVIETRLAEQGL